MASSLLVLTFGAIGASCLSAVSGMGGGIILFALLNIFYPPPVALALHALAQIASNGTRIAVFLRYVKWHLLVPYAIGSTVGIGLASAVFLSLPEQLMQMVIALFLASYALFNQQVARLPVIAVARHNLSFLPIGLLAGLLSMTLGAVGPVLSPFIKENIAHKESFIATKALLQIWVQCCKSVVLLTVFAFSVGDYAVELGLMIAALLSGTLLGKHWLKHINELWFDKLLRAALLLVAISMLLEATAGQTFI